jgi:hypothetical protein
MMIFLIVVVICWVGKDAPIGQHISITQTIWQLSAGDKKSIPALEFYIIWNTGRLVYIVI